MTAPLLDHTAATLLTAIPETALLVAVTAIVLACLPALTAAVRSRVWTVVFLAAILLSFAAPAHNHAAGAPSGFHLGATWELALLSAWVILSAVRALTLLRSAVHLHQVIRRATPLTLAAELSPILKLSPRSLASIPVCLSQDVDAPSVAGFFHPRILLPSSLAADLTQADLRAILLHEMQHLRRRDHWTNLLQKCAPRSAAPEPRPRLGGAPSVPGTRARLRRRCPPVDDRYPPTPPHSPTLPNALSSATACCSRSVPGSASRSSAAASCASSRHPLAKAHPAVAMWLQPLRLYSLSA